LPLVMDLLALIEDHLELPVATRWR
jgi:hypothetical protein